MSYVRGAAGYFLVADGTRAETLGVASSIQARVTSEIGPVPFLLLLNKADLQESWDLSGPVRRDAGEAAAGRFSEPAPRPAKASKRPSRNWRSAWCRERCWICRPAISEWLLQLVKSQRAVAYLLVDGEQILVNAGGDLENYGLTGLHHQQPACDQLPFLEGLLPLPETPFLLRSMGMPSGRVADVHFFADEDATWVVLLDVTAEHDEAQKIQQKAYDMTLLSQREARLIAKLEAAHKELTLAHHELAESREALLRDPQSAAAGVARCRALRACDPAAADRRAFRRRLALRTLAPNSAETPSATTGSIPSTSRSTSWMSAVMASAPRCCRSP